MDNNRKAKASAVEYSIYSSEDGFCLCRPSYPGLDIYYNFKTKTWEEFAWDCWVKKLDAKQLQKVIGNDIKRFDYIR